MHDVGEPTIAAIRGWQESLSANGGGPGPDLVAYNATTCAFSCSSHDPKRTLQLPAIFVWRTSLAICLARESDKRTQDDERLCAASR